MASHFHNKHHHSAHTRQFVSKSSHVDRSASADNSELSVESLIKNLENVIIEELPVSCVARSSVSLPASSATSSPAALPQSSTLAPVSGSPTPATPVPATSTPATPGFTVSAFLTSSPCFKEMLHRLSESHFSRITPSLNSVKIVRKIVMGFTVHEVVIFTDIKELFTTVKFNIVKTFTLMNFFEMIDLY
ncbi:uncharacterized protein BDCG_02452 [Blastomyces dermatitidis ER-3]|uniref:Flocculation protein FLO11-like n=1 Tax=Ajellomyces dermatitidis (strain ER-3 / ATCC MYA-2586) TaxID=559297 RepID=A0ABP2ETW4_AJEDR|nr:uncharacterized protein BDCG_02452 [Blastomyces dermatitidis ER-3]EEQ87332.2 hypothetical protein BDCG_02452 [Blastomyces dermatitidis ER-3]